MIKSKEKVPSLRFPKFDNELGYSPLFSLTSKISDGIHSTPKYDEAGEYYFVNGNNLKNGKIILDSNTKKITKLEYEKHKRHLDESTILMSINGTIGNLGLYQNQKIMLGKSACYINTKKDENKDYIYYYLQINKTRNYFYSELTGSTIKNLSLKTIKNLIVLAPTKAEQKKIADFLSSVDKRIELMEKKLELLKEYKKGVMQKIFSQEIRFKQDDGSDFPDWEEKKLGEVCEIKGRIGYRGYTIQDIVKKGEGAISLSPSNIIDGKLNLNNSTYISWLKYEESPEIKIESGDVVLVKTASVGKSAMVKNLKQAATINPQLVILKDRKIDDDFLAYSIYHEGIQKQIIAYVASGVVPNLSQKNISKFKIKCPEIIEQKIISCFLNSIDDKIEAMKNLIEKTKKFKKGLLQQMFV